MPRMATSGAAVLHKCAARVLARAYPGAGAQVTYVGAGSSGDELDGGVEELPEDDVKEGLGAKELPRGACVLSKGADGM